MVTPGRNYIGMRVLVLALMASACGSGDTNSNTLTSPTSTTTAPPPSNNPVVCFSFSPPRAEASSDFQRLAIQIVSTGSSCSWAATAADQWITVIRSGPLYHLGSGPLTFEVDGNKDERFGGCPTTARTGRITVSEEATGREARLEVLQQGSPGPFRPPTACVVTPISFGVTTVGSLAGNDCTANGARTKYYTFQGFSGQQIAVGMTAGRFTSGGLQVPVVRLYGPSGGFITSAGGNVVIDDPHISRRLSCGGTYALEVSSIINSVFNPTGLGNFSLRLNSQN